MKTQCLQTNEMQYSLGKEKLEQLGKERKELALIKSLIDTRENYSIGASYNGSTKSLIKFVS
jgi:hypothetical protein